MKIFALALFTLITLNSNAAFAQFEVFDSYLELNDYYGSYHLVDDDLTEGHFTIGQTYENIATSFIVIKEADPDTAQSRETRVTVKVALSQSGINLSAATTSGRMALRFISGKKLSDIVGYSYGGGSARIAALINLGVSYWLSGKGVLITDFESLVVGVGAKFTDTKLSIMPAAHVTHPVLVTNELNNKKKYSYYEAKDIVFGQ